MSELEQKLNELAVTIETEDGEYLAISVEDAKKLIDEQVLSGKRREAMLWNKRTNGVKDTPWRIARLRKLQNQLKEKR